MTGDYAGGRYSFLRVDFLNLLLTVQQHIVISLAWYNPTPRNLQEYGTIAKKMIRKRSYH